MTFALDKIPTALWPIKVLQDHWGGKFSGGKWIAYHDQGGHDDLVWNDSQTGARAAKIFWKKVIAAGDAHEFWWIAVGETPDKAVEALVTKALKTA